MEWRKSYLDLLLIPLSLMLPIIYHCWLWHMVQTKPHRTIMGINAIGRRRWVLAIIKDNEKKNILAVQTTRNTIMGSTLMATTSILLCTGMAALLSSNYSVKKPVGDFAFGAHGELMVSLKYVTLLVLFLFSFFLYSLSIVSINHFNFLINSLNEEEGGISIEYVCGMLEKALVLNSVGNSVFYAALPLLLWIFGPVLVFFSSLVMIPIMYGSDVVCDGKGPKGHTMNDFKDDDLII